MFYPPIIPCKGSEKMKEYLSFPIEERIILLKQIIKGDSLLFLYGPEIEGTSISVIFRGRTERSGQRLGIERFLAGVLITLNYRKEHAERIRSIEIVKMG